MIHGHGDDLYKAGGAVKVNFSTNVWYGADVESLRTMLLSKMEKILHYPDPDAGSFVKVAAEYHQVKPEAVIAGNGATELFYLIAHAFSGGRTLLPVPSFSEYEDACTLYDHHIEYIKKLNIKKLPDDDFNLMFICNPNNPDGRIWTQEEIRAILEYYPAMTLVVDESFIHFAPEIVSAQALLDDYPNLLIVHSMTKNYAMPGLRLGYMLGDSQVIEFIRGFKQPWTVNALAIEAGKYFLKCADKHLPDPAELLARQREFSGVISTIPGFEPLKSHTSFFLVKTKYNSAELKGYLLEKHGILIRDASNFHGLDNHYFRINTLTPAQNDLLIAALRTYVEEK